MLERIKEQAKKNGWSMSHLCRQLNIHVSFFTDVKNGKLKISADRLNKIAQILNCSVEYLKGETDEPTPPAQMAVSPNKQKLLDLIDTLSDEQAKRFAELIESMK